MDATEGGLRVGAAARLRAGAARSGAGAEGAEARLNAVDRARVGVAGARLRVVRAGLAAEGGHFQTPRSFTEK